MLAVAGTDNRIRIFTRSDDQVEYPYFELHSILTLSLVFQFTPSVTLSGHEDWIRALAFNDPSPSDSTLVLASGSQDNTIRLWNIEPHTKSAAPGANVLDDKTSEELLDAFEESLGDLGQEGEDGGRQISMKRHILSVKANQYSITFDALLIGHEAAVTCLSWSPRCTGIDNTSDATPTLLSTSVDSSVILWSPSTVIAASLENAPSVLWINRQRFGDVGGQRLGGFVGGLWSSNGREVLAWGWSGGWRAWNPVDTVQDVWEETGAVTGHKGPVKGLAWAPNGEYLASVG